MPDFIKYTIAFLILLIVVGFCTNQSTAAEFLPGTTLEKAAKSTYKLNLNGKVMNILPARMPMCSVVAISPTQFVTAAHCVPRDVKARKLSVVTENLVDYEVVSEEHLYLNTLRVDWDDDTAFLELKDKNKVLKDYVTIATDVNFTLGDDVFAIGYPRVQDLTITEGMFTAEVPLPGTEEQKDRGTFYKVTAPITGGSSGGGLYQRKYDAIYDEWKYELVGLATAGYRDVSFQNYFSTHEALQKITKGLITLPAPDLAPILDEEVRIEEPVKEKYLDAWKKLER